jgi:hypothetical protein
LKRISSRATSRRREVVGESGVNMCHFTKNASFLPVPVSVSTPNHALALWHLEDFVSGIIF